MVSSVPWKSRMGIPNSLARATWSKASQSNSIRLETAHSVVVPRKRGRPRSSAWRSTTAFQSSTGASSTSARTRFASGDSCTNWETMAPPIESPSRTNERAPRASA